MIKIFLKAAILVFIILSIYFIVNPSACSNLMMGRVTNSPDTEPQIALPASTADHSEMFIPSGDKPLRQSASQEQKVEGITDTNSLATDNAGVDYSQEDIDYAIASRYVELENEYAQAKKTTKNTAKEISYQVMDDFELTPEEWEDFLQRATKSNLFDKVRRDVAAAK